MLRPHPRSRMGNPCSVAQLIAAHYCFGGGFFFGGAAGLGGGATGASCANTGFGANFGSDTPCTRAGSSPRPYRAHSAEQNSRLRALVRKVSQGHEFRSEKRFLLLPQSRRPGYKGGGGILVIFEADRENIGQKFSRTGSFFSLLAGVGRRKIRGPLAGGLSCVPK